MIIVQKIVLSIFFFFPIFVNVCIIDRAKPDEGGSGWFHSFVASWWPPPLGSISLHLPPYFHLYIFPLFGGEKVTPASVICESSLIRLGSEQAHWHFLLSLHFLIHAF